MSDLLFFLFFLVFLVFLVKIVKKTKIGYIVESGTGDLIIYGSGETLAKFIDDGAVELYNNNVKTFETVGTGVSIINQVSVGATATFDAKVITGTGATVGFGSTAYFKDNAKLSIDTNLGNHFISSKSTHLNEENQEAFDLQTYKKFLSFLKFQEMMDKYNT